ncbi:MAG: efflux RND transporter periplasmic adaptor subunit [Thiotrichaceae bacterium]
MKNSLNPTLTKITSGLRDGVLASVLVLTTSILSPLFAEKNDHHLHSEHSEYSAPTNNEHDQHDEHDNHSDHDKRSGRSGHRKETPAEVKLTKQQMEQAGIQTLRLKTRSINHYISALGEVKLNQYRTIKVSPTMTTRIEKRHVRLGDIVKKGQLLVTLHTIATTDISANMLATADLATSSAELAVNIATAKGELATANSRWNRIRSLGRDAVSGKRYMEAEMAKQQAEEKLKAYGKSQAQVKRLLKSGSKATKKHFKLVAEQAGTIIKDDFVLGQVVTPEDVLIEISDLGHLWVEANIKPDEIANIAKESAVTITANGEMLQGKVINIGRIINEKTRTLAVRIEVNSSHASLYPGQFVKTRISGKSTHSAISVPAEAILRSADGDWMLFVEIAPGRFKPREVEIVEDMGADMVISGIKAGTIIVSKGAFTVQSELAKSGFSVHNH